ncbi:hypothetical protein BGW80DRAFT_154050 [Lactifluus volemus]|nr:hypothetical protein BGW80DRAFT_154050 [Lactifluus volemus]
MELSLPVPAGPLYKRNESLVPLPLPSCRLPPRRHHCKAMLNRDRHQARNSHKKARTRMTYCRKPGETRNSPPHFKWEQPSGCIARPTSISLTVWYIGRSLYVTATQAIHVFRTAKYHERASRTSGPLRSWPVLLFACTSGPSSSSPSPGSTGKASTTLQASPF